MQGNSLHGLSDYMMKQFSCLDADLLANQDDIAMKRMPLWLTAVSTSSSYMAVGDSMGFLSLMNTNNIKRRVGRIKESGQL